MKEEFRDIKGYEGRYQVSNLGRIKSLAKKWLSGNGKMGIHQKKDTISKLGNANGYSITHLSNGMKMKAFKVARLVAIHFIPNPEKYTQVNHKNGIKTDNRVENLEWCTQSQNIQHSYKTGLNPHIGENHSRSKVKEFQVKEMRRKYKEGSTIQNLMDEYGFSANCIYRIVTYYSWKHIH